MQKKAATTKTAAPRGEDVSRDKKGQPGIEKKITKKKAKPKKKAAPKKRGVKSTYTDEIADQILQKIAGSANGLEHICKSNPLFPNPVTVRRWLNANENFRINYARAREEQADFIADQIMHISDTLAKKVGKTSEDVQAARLQVDSRKWIAAKLKPKKYGDKTDITTDGESLNNGFYDFLKRASITNMSPAAEIKRKNDS